ncbi:MAG: hypothetical protein J6X26_00890 [Bacteroidales bacterium]|nr:hypothetical protein [Bacteroidales bacterium]
MRYEEQKLLIKDLCARLPYGVMVDVLVPYGEDMHRVEKLIGITNLTSYEMGWSFEMAYTNELGMESRTTIYADNEEEIPKPYLRPMLSMTEEEFDELERVPSNIIYTDGTLVTNGKDADWLNSRHYDYRGLISKGLANIAPKGMYNTK